jgi:hypothetical protein
VPGCEVSSGLNVEDLSAWKRCWFLDEFRRISIGKLFEVNGIWDFFWNLLGFHGDLFWHYMNYMGFL